MSGGYDMTGKNWIFLGLLFIAGWLCTGSCLAQNNTTASGVLDAAGELGLTEFSELIESTGFANTLDNQGVLLIGSGSFVIFAPSDEAFNAVDDMVMNTLVENQTELLRILSYHAVWNSGSFVNISDIDSARTLQGENLSINNTGGLMVNGANVTESMEYDNGIIYVIDGVLMPEKSSMAGVAEAAESLEAVDFASAIEAEGLEERLNGQGLMGIATLAEGPFTIFAPSDEAFDAAKSAVDSVKKQDMGMVDLLGYHMVEAKDLINMTDSGSAKSLQGESLAVDSATGYVSTARVLGSERYSNGIVYRIDQVLVPISLSL
jgi:uncharacterized surface protein with fasciclin (FAS1) repeats